MRRGTFFVIGIVLLGGFGAHFTWTASGRGDFEERLDLIRASGAPIYVTDLATPPIPDEENAAKLLEEAYAWLEQYNTGKRDWLFDHLDEHWTDEERDAFWQHLEGARPFFEMIERIPGRPGWHLDLDLGAGPGVQIGCIPWLQHATMYLHARVKFDPEERGRTRRAAETAILLVHLGERSRMPYLIGHLVQLTVRCSSAGILRVASAQQGFDATLFRKLVDARVAAAIPPIGPPSHPLAEERARVLWIVRAWLAGESLGDHAEDGLKRSPLWRPLLYDDASRMLDMYHDAIATCGTTPERSATLAQTMIAGQEDPGDLYPVTQAHQSLFPKLFYEYAASVARLRLMRLVMALLEYEQKHGAWPESLDVLGEMPHDPFSGEPFRYERTEKGARIRSARDRDWEELEEVNLAWSFED